MAEERAEKYEYVTREEFFKWKKEFQEYKAREEEREKQIKEREKEREKLVEERDRLISKFWQERAVYIGIIVGIATALLVIVMRWI